MTEKEIELRVAKAIWNSGPSGDIKWDELDDSKDKGLKKEILAMARAAIKELRKIS